MTTSDAYAAGVTQPTPPTDTPPDPSEVGDATVDAMSTGDLSDEANASLYPDVEHPDPPELPPDAMQVPPPLEQRQSNLLDIIRAYASGQTDWPSTKQALIDFDYQPMPPRVGSPVGPSKGDWYTDVEADVGTDAPDDTWAQLLEATDAGMLSRDERNQVLAARSQAQTEQEQADQGQGGDGSATQ